MYLTRHFNDEWIFETMSFSMFYVHYSKPPERVTSNCLCMQLYKTFLNRIRLKFLNTAERNVKPLGRESHLQVYKTTSQGDAIQFPKRLKEMLI